MKTRNRRVVFTIFLPWSGISSGTFNIRTVDFLSILAIGMLTGLLIANFAFPGEKE